MAAMQVRPDAMRPVGTLKIHVVDGQHVVATHANMIFIGWRGETRLPAIADAKKILLETFAGTKGACGLMQFVEVGTPPPSSAARAALADMLACGRGRIVCSSLIFPGTGFFAATARAFVTGLTLVARPGFPHTVFPAVHAAAEWHIQLLAKEQALTHNEICASFDRVKAAFEQVK